MVDGPGRRSGIATSRCRERPRDRVDGKLADLKQFHRVRLYCSLHRITTCMIQR
jgi:hypothetical protein